MIRFKTDSGSIYELDKEKLLVRKQDAPRWKEFTSIISKLEVGQKLILNLPNGDVLRTSRINTFIYRNA